MFESIIGAAMRQTSRFVGTAPALKRPSSEGVDAGQLLADDELVHGFRAFVGNYALEVKHVTNRYVFGADPGAAQDIAGIARDIDSRTAVVPLGQ